MNLVTEVRAFKYICKNPELNAGGYLSFYCPYCSERNKRAMKSGEVFERVPQQVLVSPHSPVEKGVSVRCHKCGGSVDVFGPLGRQGGVVR